AELNYLRNRGYPYILQRLYRWEVMLQSFSQRSEENARRAKELLFSVQNSRKAREGGLAGLLDPAIMKKKREEDQKLQEMVAKSEKLKEAAEAWKRIEQAEKVRAATIQKYTLLESKGGFNCKLFDIARTLVRAAEERPKPNSDRLREFRDSNLESLQLELFSDEPLYDDFEQLKLAGALTWMSEQAGAL